MTGKSSMARRVAPAPALIVSFYALALSIAIGLLGIAYADVVHSKARVSKLIVFCRVPGGSSGRAFLGSACPVIRKYSVRTGILHDFA